MPPKILHIEPTDACNAACPQCARELNSNFNKNNIHHLTIEQIEKVLSASLIVELDKMFMCGVYGDPAAGKYTLEIYQYFRKINPKITLGMNTNGSIRNKLWWTSLAKIFNQPTDYVVFSIDGLKNTNHIYRINVDWESLINNVRSFIEAGGRAHWDMLVFEHNEHQISEAQKLAKNLGFKWFRAKISNRHDEFPVDFLQKPSTWKLPAANTRGPIICQALKEQSLYINAQGKVFPCCWLSADENSTLDYFDSIQHSWNTDKPNVICQKTCSSIQQINNFTQQWQLEVELCS